MVRMPSPRYKTLIVRVLIPLPDRDFDVTEVAVPWRLLTDAGHDAVFATERGAQPRKRTGDCSTVYLRPPRRLRRAQGLLSATGRDHGLQRPLAWADVRPDDYDGLLLSGGHAPGMRQYLSSTVLQGRVSEFWSLGRPVGAICHGVLVLARTRDAGGRRSVIADRRTTCLPKYMERGAYYLTAWRLGRYYRTYPAYVQDEVTASLDDPGQFVRGPRSQRRGTSTDHSAAFVVEDGNYVSARWPGDAYLFAERFRRLLERP